MDTCQVNDLSVLVDTPGNDQSVINNIMEDQENSTELSALVDRSSSDESVAVSGDEVCIMVAGKPGNGKSTALNNLFDLNLETKISSRSVTTKILKKKIVKNDVSLIVLDTPGLGALDIDKEAITTAMVEALSNMDYTLLYCLSVGPGSRLTETDKAIIENLQATLGTEVWDKCVVLFTFSDTARDCFSSDVDYKDYLKDVAEEFSKVLKGSSSEAPVVKSIFECQGREDISLRTEGGKDVVAIPVGKDINRAMEANILPGILQPTEDWTDLVFFELMRKTKEKRRKQFVKLKYGLAVAGSLSTSMVVGAVIGGAVGVAAGIVGGPGGVIVGGGLGVTAGAGVAAAVVMSVSSVVFAVRKWKKTKATRQLLPDK